MLADINARIERSHTLFNEQSGGVATLTRGADFGQKMRFILAMPIVYIFDFLL
jgi:hypothetical protein